MKWSGSLIAFLLTATGLVAATMGYTRLVLNQVNAGPYPVRGIDVSHHQGVIDWQAVSRANVAFAYIKASEGADNVDELFAANWSEARRAGVLRGAYHFFTFCTAGAPQAAHFIKLVRPGETILPPAVDVEFAGNCETPPNRRAIRKELHALLDGLEAAYRRKPVIYATLSASWLIIDDSFTDYPLWIRNLHTPPGLMGSPRWRIWQHSASGAVAGIGTAVDLNVFAGDAKALARCASTGDCR